MNYSTAVFLINKHVRAILCSYESDRPSDKLTTFKTLDGEIKVGDLVIVPTDTRAKFTVVKAVEVDADIDFDSTTQIGWIVGRVDREPYDKIVAQEATAIEEIKSAEIRQKRERLAESLKANHSGLLGTLALSDHSDDTRPKTAPASDTANWR